jgi:hypothetical protein
MVFGCSTSTPRSHLLAGFCGQNAPLLFDLENDTLYDIGEGVAANCSENRALGIADAIKAAVKRKRWRPAG